MHFYGLPVRFENNRILKKIVLNCLASSKGVCFQLNNMGVLFDKQRFSGRIVRVFDVYKIACRDTINKYCKAGLFKLNSPSDQTGIRLNYLLKCHVGLLSASEPVEIVQRKPWKHRLVCV